MAKPALTLSRLERIVHGFARVRLLVVGDVMLDEYLWGDVERVSPEAPVPVVHVQRESHALGGAGNVVRNVVAMGARCGFCAVVGEDAAGDRIVDLLKDLGVDPAGVVRDGGRPTTRKTRVEARSQQLLRYDRETDEAIPCWTDRTAIPWDRMSADDRLWLPHVLEGRDVDGRFVFDGDAMLDHDLRTG